MSYTVTGPFTNGSSPGISAAFLNNIESYISLLDNAPVTTLTGSTSGTMKFYQLLQGTNIKVVFFQGNNFRNGGSGPSYTLPSAFTTGFMGIHTSINGLIYKSGGSTQNVDVFTSAGNMGTGQTSAQDWIWFQCNHACDTIATSTGNTSAKSGWGFYIGI